MKKLFSYFILILSIFVFSACGEDPIVSYVQDTIIINMGQVYGINRSDISISNTKDKCEILVLDESIAIVENDKIIPKSEGETTLRFQVENGEFYYDVKLIITNNINATSVSVEKSQVNIDINNSANAENKLVLNNGCNEVPNVIISNNIVTYDYLTGAITATATGEATIQVKFKSCSVSFVVVVTGVIYVEQVNISNLTIYEGATGVFVAAIYPDNANTYWYQTESDLISVSKSGEFQALRSGKATVVLYYKTSKNVEQSKSFTVTVLEVDKKFDVVLTNLDGSTPSKIFKEQKYKITISGIDDILSKELLNIEGISVVFQECSNNKVYIEFYFLNSGVNILKFEFTMGGILVAQKLVEFSVETYEDFTVKAKWITNAIKPNNQGKYCVYLNSTINNSYITFSLYYKGEKMGASEYKFYDVSSGVAIETSTTFEPTELGEYVLQFTVENVVVKTINVIVIEDI